MSTLAQAILRRWQRVEPEGGWPQDAIAWREQTDWPDRPPWALVCLEVQWQEHLDAEAAWIAELREITHSAIMLAYGADSHEDEIRLRLRNAHTEAQDEERDRLLARYRELRTEAVWRMHLGPPTHALLYGGQS